MEAIEVRMPEDGFGFGPHVRSYGNGVVHLSSDKEHAIPETVSRIIRDNPNLEVKGFSWLIEPRWRDMYKAILILGQK